MEIKFIGTGNIRSKCTSYLLDKHILFDCGFGTVRTMCDADLFAQVDTVIISHLHPDHVGDIIYFILTCFVRKRPSESLQIIAPTGTKQFIENLNYATFCGDLHDNLDEYFTYFKTVLANMVELSDGQTFTNAQMTLRAFRVIHGLANSNAYILKLGDKTIGCTGDTSYCQSLAANLPHAEVWVIDTTHQKEIEHKRHLSLEKLEEIANLYRNQKFYAVHGRTYTKETACPNIYFPHDGATIII